ncbi:hypothetical protein FC093_19665 [Ilyomonas limi]|uniref:Methane oxygenase PmoA n=1 Tax=Ilyomonas limi TaxID=2575867 RepID=A0A4U3KWV2_9BACT|nr:PmoA family protein [Ilyomonas limi]TKK65537.1 hypothetical protein FC093_19665 [Ilyomonas limi]
MIVKKITAALCMCFIIAPALAQKNEMVNVMPNENAKQIAITIGGQPFTTFWYPDTLEKPMLFPIAAANGTIVTRGFPLVTRAGDPTDHPHHVGLWFTFENVNGLDFWNNSYAIPKEKESGYGWIKTDKILRVGSGEKGTLSYHANWTNEANKVLLEEVTHYVFSGNARQRIIDRITTLTADTTVLFKDAKDGMLGLRVAHELQIPSKEDQQFMDDKGNVTVVKGGNDTIANGNYLTSEGKTGDDAWSTRARWCKIYGKMGNDSVSITIIDHPANINYPTFWHARGYGLFAANPLGENIFTNGKSAKNLQLHKGESVTFRYRIIIQNGSTTLSPKQLDMLADNFAKVK